MMIAMERRQNATPTISFASSSPPPHSSSAGSVSGSVSSSFVATTSASSSTSSETVTKSVSPEASGVPATQQGSDRDHTNRTAKAILEWLFLGFALLLLAVIAIRRANKLRNENVSLSHFFHRRDRYRRRRSQDSLSSPVTTEISSGQRRLPRTTGLPALSPTTASAPYHLAEIPVARLSGDRHGNDRYAHQINHLLYGPARRARTRAADIDQGGRRGGGERGIERDYCGDEEGDEAGGLPAYDKHGSPPVYVEVLGVRATHTRPREVPRPQSIDSRGNGECSVVPSRADPPSYPGPPLPAVTTENPFSTQGEQMTSITPVQSPPPPRTQRSLRSSTSPMMPGTLSNW